ncbi:MAG TPA: serine/threonine-protein kinase, partial [Vicinamibacteria bacterium]|nr:serine/threonine-protein kinase [Vicinamibacteria bacterium]
MDLEALSQNLTELGHADIELEALYRRHRETGGDDDRDGFLTFLLNENRIGPAAFAALSSDATVIVTERLTGGLAETDMPTVLQAEKPRTGDPVDVDAPTIYEPSGPRDATSPAASLHGPSHYVVLGTAGRGAMGTVQVARDVDLLRKVALKQLAPEFAGDRGATARFIREVQVTAQLDHPHIVPVYGLEASAGGRPAYTMKLVQGRTFVELIRDTQAFYEEGKAPIEGLSLPARLEYFLKVCDAVHYAHERGVIHRDLKPANLMLGQYNEVYVMDWG